MSPSIGFNHGQTAHTIAPEHFGFTYAWLEGRMEARLVRYSEVAGNWKDLQRWPAGRLFGPGGEYRWRLDRLQKVRAVMLVDSGRLPEGFEGQLNLEREKNDQQLILWGVWVDYLEDPEGNPDGGPCFYAGEIPAIQAYPLDESTENLANAAKQKKTPRLTVCCYRCTDFDANPAAGSFVRCVGFDLINETTKEGSDESDQSV